MIMNVNVNDISGFDATAEEIRQVYAERDRLREENEELRQFNEFRRGHERLKYNIKKQEEFTEEAASILGVHPGDVSLSDVLAALRKLKRCEELNGMNSEIIADLKDKCDKEIVRGIREADRRIETERHTAECLSKICSALGIEYSTDTTLEYILDTIDDLKARSLEFNLRKENFKKLCDILGREPNHTTWLDIYDEVEGLRSKYLNLCGDFACFCNKLGLDSTEYNRSNALAKIDELKDKNGKYSQFFVFTSVCDYLGFSADDATLSDIHDEIKRLKECEGKYRSLCDDVAWYYMELDLNYTQCNRAGVMAKINDMKTHMDALQKSTARHDKKRREWVRKYEEEHKRANSCDKLYKKYKALYDMDAPAREKLSDGLASYRASYEAVRNKAIKYRSLMNAAEKKANHWDILVDGYGKETIRSLFENIGIDVSGDKGNGLFE